MDDLHRKIESILERCERGRISPAVALMEMFIETEDEARVRGALAAAVPRSEAARTILDLQDANGRGCAQVVAMLRSGVDSPPKGVSIEEGVAFCKGLFDWSVRQSEEASVALYSLGNPSLLETATAEIVALLEAWGSLGRDKRAIDVGCGIGRMEVALSPKLASIRAVDVSGEMVAVAQRRCAALDNVVVSICSGLDLGAFESDAFELVFAVDSFPYVVQSGMPLVDMYFAEAARVLRAGGELVILNFSYRDEAADRADVTSLAAAHGFDILTNGEAPFAFWNGTAFRMRRSRR